MGKIPCSARIKEGLEARDLKPADLCKMTNINKSTMSQYLNGLYEPGQLKIEIIARALRVDEAWLMGYDVPMETEKPTTATDSGLSDEELNLFKSLSKDDFEIVLSVARQMKQKEIEREK